MARAPPTLALLWKTAVTATYGNPRARVAEAGFEIGRWFAASPAWRSDSCLTRPGRGQSSRPTASLARATGASGRELDTFGR